MGKVSCFSWGHLATLAQWGGFLITEWRDGTLGAWIMGFRHGAYCVGCCGPFMALLFVFGVMNVLWVAALSI